jgi:hypothetical protein
MNGHAVVGGPLPWDGGWGSAPARVLDDDFDLDEHFARLTREMDGSRVQPPPEGAIGGLDQAGLSAAFAQDGAAETLRPGPALADLTAHGVASAGSIGDDELVGVLQAARRMANLAAYQQTVAIAEFARRRQAQFEAARESGVPVGCRDGEFPGEELAMELVDTGAYTGARIDTAIELTARLPRTLAGMANGTIDLDRACTIASRTRVMTDADAAFADEVLAAVAPDLRPDQLARKAAALELKLAPEAVAARKELARRLDQRVEARREQSGNASLSGRELGSADVLASKAHIDAIALKLRDSGLIEGSLGRLRALALTDLTQGRDPLDRIKPRPAEDPEAAPPANNPPAGSADRASDASGAGESGGDADDASAEASEPATDSPSDPLGYAGPAHPSEPAPLPALINLLIPAGTLLGWGTAPGEAAGWGLLDAEETQALVRAASMHPRTRWCTTIIAPDGTALAHGCASGQHPWPANAPPSESPLGSRPGPDPRQAAQLLDLLRRLNVTLEPIARDTCDHRAAEDRYVPSRKLKHLVRARNQTCSAPACNAQAVYCDLDHTVPYPDGPTDQCNLNPKCRRHHRTKQASGWKVTQPTPGTAVWTTPSGRTHTTTPTVYDL